MSRFNFTVKGIKSLPVPEKGTSHYRDHEVRGLELILTPGKKGEGRRSFYFSRKFRNESIRILIGTFPEKTIEQARKKYNERLKSELKKLKKSEILIWALGI